MVWVGVSAIAASLWIGPGPVRAAPARLAPPKAKLVLTPIAASSGEDGHGGKVAAVDPLALQVQGKLPVRALDPVLHVGALHFHHYSHPAKGVLRFVVADRALLPRGAAAYLQWGSDTASRVPVARALEVPK